MQVLLLVFANVCIVAFVFDFCNSILTKRKNIVQIMKMQAAN